jgi:RimJ/RimL family protein N-acetyltransferase
LVEDTRPLLAAGTPAGTADRHETAYAATVIDTERLCLVILDADAAKAVVAGDRTGRDWHPEFPREDDRDAAGMVGDSPDPIFGCRIIVEKDTGLAIGTIGFFGPADDDGAVMVGYGIVEPARLRGYATEALRGLVRFGLEQPSVRTILAESLQDNVPSHRVLLKAGFRQTHSTDEAHWYALDQSEG